MNKTAPSTRPPAWEPEEDAKFVSILETEILTNGKSLEEVYPIVAEAVGRPEGGCKYRYTAAIRKSLTGKLKEKLVDNSRVAGRSIPGVTPVVENNRSKLITRISQVDKDMVKVDTDIAKAEKLLIELKAKKIELGDSMARYTELLVQQARGGDKVEDPA